MRRRSDETFSSLIEHAPIAIYVVDAAFRLRAINPRAEPLFHDVDPLLGREFAEVAAAIWPEPLAGDVVARFRHTLATGEPYAAPCLAEAAAESGDMAAYDWQIQRITLPDGTAGVACYAYDLRQVRDAERAVSRAAVERTRAEARLQDSDARAGRYTAAQVMELARFVQEVDPGVLQRLAGSEPCTFSAQAAQAAERPPPAVAGSLTHVPPTQATSAIDAAAFVAGSAAASGGSGSVDRLYTVPTCLDWPAWVMVASTTSVSGASRRRIRFTLTFVGSGAPAACMPVDVKVTALPSQPATSMK